MNMIPRHADATLTARVAPPRSIAVVQLHSGFCVDLLAPDLRDLTLTDIATGLSRIARFVGATKGAHPYTVAQHSCLVADILEQRRETHAMQKAGLLHDAHEALMGDIISPVKAALGRHVVHELERRLQVALSARFGLGPMIWCQPTLDQADADALATERRDLMARPTWPWPEARGDALDWLAIEPWSEARAHCNWLRHAARLGLR